MTPDDAAAARRAFIRDHHPDRGGDPEAFRAGLAAFDTPEAVPAPRVQVTAFRTPKGPVERAQHLMGRLGRSWTSRNDPKRVR